MIRRSTHFTGRVQGVGFRYTTLHIAKGFSVTGFVRNLPDGRVEVVCEGEPPEIGRFIEAIALRMQDFVKNRTDFDSAATGEYHGFVIR